MKDDLDRDWQQTLRKVAQLRVHELEFAGYFGPSPQACRAELDRLGLRALAGGGVYKALMDDFGSIVDVSHTLGKKFVCCYWPWLDGGQGKTESDWQRLGDTMNALGGRLRAEGLQLAYHNHDMEFIPWAGGSQQRLPFDALIAAMDPKMVTMQLDLWWVDKSGQRAERFLRTYPHRFSILHIKERRNVPEAGMVCDGSSMSRMQTIMQGAKAAGVRHYIVENEDPKDHYACAAKTLKFMRRFGV